MNLTFSLQNPDLFRQQAFVGGRWCDAESGATIEVNNPATGEILGTVPRMGANETWRAIEAAKDAFADWSRRPAKERSNLLRGWYDLIMANVDDLGALMTAEQGKPLAEAKGEVVYAASFIEWFAEEAKRVYGDTIPSPWKDRRLVVIKQPIGVCAAITPWNFPAAMIGQKLARPSPRDVPCLPSLLNPHRFPPWPLRCLLSGPASRLASSTFSPGKPKKSVGR